MGVIRVECNSGESIIIKRTEQGGNVADVYLQDGEAIEFADHNFEVVSVTKMPLEERKKKREAFLAERKDRHSKKVTYF